MEKVCCNLSAGVILAVHTLAARLANEREEEAGPSSLILNSCFYAPLSWRLSLIDFEGQSVVFFAKLPFLSVTSNPRLHNIMKMYHRDNFCNIDFAKSLHGLR